MGLHGLLRAARGDLIGIVNGIDDTVWDPATDPDLRGRLRRPAIAPAAPPTGRRCRSASASIPIPTRCCAPWSAG